jgi:hypothetical protein
MIIKALLGQPFLKRHPRSWLMPHRFEVDQDEPRTVIICIPIYSLGVTDVIQVVGKQQSVSRRQVWMRQSIIGHDIALCFRRAVDG